MTSTSIQRIWIVLLLIGSFSGLRAQEYKYEIGGMAGGSFYMGDLNKNAFFKGLNPSLGAVFRYNANFRWAVKADLLWARISGSNQGQVNIFPEKTEVSFSRNLIELGGQMEFNFFPYSDKYAYVNTKRFTPYVLLGIGFTMAPGNGSTFAGIHVPLGIGLKYKVKNRVNLGCEFSFRKLFGDNLEGLESQQDPYDIKSSFLKNKDWYSLLLLSVTWDFGPRSRPCNSKYSISGY